MDNGHPDAAADARRIERHGLAVPPDAQVHEGRAELQIAQRHLVEKCGQSRIAQSDLVCERIEFEPEAGLQKRERRRRGPRLRRACDRIKCRPLTVLALETAEQLRQAPVVHVGAGVEQAFE